MGDGPDYENIAYQLYNGHGFRIDTLNANWRSVYEQTDSDYSAHLQSPPRQLQTTGRPPLFPLVVCGIYQVIGRNEYAFAAVRIFLATCLALSGALSVWLTSHVLKDATQPWAERIGCAATLLLAASSRTLQDYATDFLTEPLALLLMQLFVLCVCVLGNDVIDNDSDQIDSRKSGTRHGMIVAAGVLLGLLILTRSMFVVWLPAIGLLVMVAAHRLTLLGRLRTAALLVLVACLVCSPWWVRNVLVLQRWMPLGTQGAITLLGGYSDAALRSNGDWQAAPELALRDELSQRVNFRSLANDSQRELEVAEVAEKRVEQWFWQHSQDLPGLFAKRIHVHWNPYSGRSLIWKLAMVLGVAGLVVHRRREAWWLLGLPLVSTLVVAMFYSTGGRFLVPLYGVLFTLGGLGVAYSWASLTQLVAQPNSTK